MDNTRVSQTKDTETIKVEDLTIHHSTSQVLILESMVAVLATRIMVASIICLSTASTTSKALLKDTVQPLSTPRRVLEVHLSNRRMYLILRNLTFNLGRGSRKLLNLHHNYSNNNSNPRLLRQVVNLLMYLTTTLWKFRRPSLKPRLSLRIINRQVHSVISIVLTRSL